MSITTKKKTLRVLVVDDNSDHAITLSILLKNSGYDAHVCNNALDCISLVTHLQPDVVLLDLAMPGITGYEIADQIKRRDDLRHISLFAISGYGQMLDRLQTKMRGFDQHLLKPIDYQELELFLKSYQESVTE